MIPRCKCHRCRRERRNAAAFVILVIVLPAIGVASLVAVFLR